MMSAPSKLQRIEEAVKASLACHAGAINSAAHLTHLEIDVKFDRSTGYPAKAVVSMQMENFVKQISINGFTFEDEQVIST